MTGRCGEFERLHEAGRLEGGAEARWREHAAGCVDCREQARADALLRTALAAPAPALSPGFDAALHRQLQRRTAARPAPRRSGHLRPGGLWALAVYGTAAAAASGAILARLPWESIAPAPALGITLGALALLSPLALLDRLGVVRPPG